MIGHHAAVAHASDVLARGVYAGCGPTAVQRKADIQEYIPKGSIVRVVDSQREHDL